MKQLAIGSITAGFYPLIALPLTDRSLQEPHSVADADIVEMRVDMFEDLTEKYVVQSIKKAREVFNKPVIATIRSFHEGGAFKIEDKQRKSLFKAIIKHTDAVDIEINSEIFGSIVKLARKNRKVSIGSFHDFEGTPPIDDLSSIVHKGKSFKADIIKLAIMPHNSDDLRTITDITLRFSDVGLITIAMGEMGMSSRIFLPMIGSLITFATLDVTTAPGQLSLGTIKEFLSVFKRNKEKV